MLDFDGPLCQAAWHTGEAEMTPSLPPMHALNVAAQRAWNAFYETDPTAKTLVGADRDSAACLYVVTYAAGRTAATARQAALETAMNAHERTR